MKLVLQAIQSCARVHDLVIEDWIQIKKYTRLLLSN